jgi:hypothetical protein
MKLVKEVAVTCEVQQLLGDHCVRAICHELLQMG